jgi:hypothetical protein
MTLSKTKGKAHHSISNLGYVSVMLLPAASANPVVAVNENVAMEARITKRMKCIIIFSESRLVFKKEN